MSGPVPISRHDTVSSATPSKTPSSSISTVASSSTAPSSILWSAPRSAKKVRKDPMPDPDVFEVQRIIARSNEPGYTSDGRHDWQYLVRWVGYPPEEDTWLFRFELLNSAAQAVHRFEAQEHPFRIIERAGTGRYLVLYGADDSPHCQRIHHTVAHIKKRGDISRETVDNTIRAYHLPVKTAADKRRRESLLKPRCILALLDRRDYKRKNTVVSEYRLRWREKSKLHEGWMARDRMSKFFGTEEAKDAVVKFKEEAEQELKAEMKRIPVLSEYEAERWRKMEENKELMRGLGI